MLEHASNRVHASVITMRASTCLYSRRQTEIFHKRNTSFSNIRTIRAYNFDASIGAQSAIYVRTKLGKQINLFTY